MTKATKTEWIAFRQDFIEAGENFTHLHQHEKGDVELRVDFQIAKDATSPTKIHIQIGDRTFVKNVPMTEQFPVVHIADRSGKHGVNLIVEIDPPTKESTSPNGQMVRTLAVVHRNNDNIQHIPDLSGLQNKVPQFAQRNPACFPRSV